MSEDAGEKTEQPTPKKLEEARERGQIARSSEVQTVFVLGASLAALVLTGRESWDLMAASMATVLGHLHDTSLDAGSMQGYALQGVMVGLRCAGPVVLAAMVGGALAGAVQNRFSTTPEALALNWDRLNPVEGLQRLFSPRAAVPTLVALFKLAIIVLLSYSTVQEVLGDPVFASSVSVGRLASFMAESGVRIFLRVLLALGVIASGDYAYQFWQTRKDQMMTRQEVQDEAKSTEGNPQIKSARRRMMSRSKRKMLAEVPLADVVVTNPTHYAVALRYDRKTMRAPIIVAKGVRRNAQQIKDIARQHQIPVVENKPLARLMYKHGKVGGQIPAELYVAVAEVLAWVYRVNRYRYYAEENAVTQPSTRQNRTETETAR